MLREIYLSEKMVTYELMYTKTKYIKCVVKQNGDIYVLVNRNHTEEDIAQFFEDCKEKIIEGINKKDKSVRNKLAGILTGEVIDILGEEKKIVVSPCEKNYVELIGNELIIHVSDVDDYDLKRSMLDKWRKKQCEQVVLEICEKVYPYFWKKGIPYPEILFRKAKGYFGRCLWMENKIHFNVKLIERPKMAIEYVVVHEFTHFLHPNHEEDFYIELRKAMPDWVVREIVLQNPQK